MQTPHLSIEDADVAVRPLQPVFQTADVDAAAYLHARAYPLLRIDRVRDVPVFTFSSEAALGAEAFYQGATVSAKLLLHAARRLEYLRNNENGHRFA